MKTNTKIIYITPEKWLCNNKSESFRNELFKFCKFSYIKFIKQPICWNELVKTSKIILFELIRGQETHDKSIICINNKIPFITCEIEKDILTKIFSFYQKYEKITFFTGCKIQIDNSLHAQHYIGYNGEEKFDKINYSITFEREINTAKQKQQKFLIYPEFSTHPFKITGKNIAKIKMPVKIVDPIPVYGTYVIVPTNTPEKFKILLESNVAKFVWRMFFSNKHFGETLTGLFPNIIRDLVNDFSNQEIYKFFNLTQEEIEHIEKLAKIGCDQML
jgi:hypothetical protein